MSRPNQSVMDNKSQRVVLVVDDELGVRSAISRALTRAGFSVLVASSAEDAVRVSREFAEQIDLLLTDIMMPGLNGHELRLLLQQSRAGLRAIYMSGYPEDLIVHVCGVDPLVEFVPKPFTTQVLVDHVRRVFDAESNILPDSKDRDAHN